jgi:hypothetical protein
MLSFCVTLTIRSEVPVKTAKLTGAEARASMSMFCHSA